MSPRRVSRAAAVLVVLAGGVASASSLSGCGTEVDIAIPRPVVTPIEPGPEPTATAPIPSAAPIRTIEDRDPFGHTAEGANLVLDGDFEITGRAAQMPWIAFGQNGQQTLNFATGGSCRSGVRCGKLVKGDAMVGFVTSPKTGNLKVSMWAKPASGTCKDLEVTLLDLDSNAKSADVPATTTSVDASGWCHVEGVLPGYPLAQAVLYLDAAGGDVLVDDALVLAEPAPKVQRLLAWNGLSPAKRARVAGIAAWVRAHRIYGVRPHAPRETPRPRRRIVGAPRD